MIRHLAGLLALACSVLVFPLLAQSPAAPAQDRSFYLGQPVVHPEQLSGIWEAPDGHGGAVGLHLVLTTTLPSSATTLDGTSQAWQSLEVSLYHRHTNTLQPGDENSFSDSLRGGGVHYENGHLTLHRPDFDLDLRRKAGDRWTGRFHRKDLDRRVTFVRGHLAASRSAWFLGTWQTSNYPSISCLHIAKQPSGALTAWIDRLVVPGGASHFAPQLSRPATAFEIYGDRTGATPSPDGSSILVGNNPNIGICCSHRFLGKSFANGTLMVGDWLGGVHETAPTVMWITLPGASCTEPEDRRR